MGDFSITVGGDKPTNKQSKTHTHIHTMTEPGLGAGPKSGFHLPDPICAYVSAVVVGGNDTPWCDYNQ